ncbi:LysM peptidoglycan-binding domain-containing protein, partial [Pseudoalteromonas sp. AC163]
VMFALTTEHDSADSIVAAPEKAQPVLEPKKEVIATKQPAKADDEVTIISFGAPKTGQFNSQQTSNYSNSAPAVTNQKNSSDVVFYEATKNTTVFENSNYQNNADIEFKSYEAVQKTELPMLNPKVSPLRVPFHVIAVGENLFSISVRYNVKLQKLLQWNGLKESDRVMNGSKIYLNDPNIYYEIKAGDSLYDIATQRHVLIDELMRWNKLSPDIALKPGHRLLLVDPDSYTL